MAETVTVPGIKKPLPKWAVAGGVAVVGLLVFQYYRSRSSASAAAAASQAASSTDQYPPDGTTGNPSDPYSTDPATGQTYGNEAAGSGGTFGAFTGGGSDQGIIGYDAAGNPVYAPGYGPGAAGGGTVAGPPFSTNAAWANYAISQLQAANPNLDVGALTDALGAYLNGQPVSAAQKTLIFDAIAVAGDPPVAGPNGYPPKVQTNGGGGGGGGGTPPAKPTGLKASPGTTSASLSWQPSKGATQYNVHVWHGKTSVHYAKQTGTSLTVHGLHRKTTYDWHVEALDSSGGAWSTLAHFTTK